MSDTQKSAFSAFSEICANIPFEKYINLIADIDMVTAALARKPAPHDDVRNALTYFSDRYHDEIKSGDFCVHEFEQHLTAIIRAAAAQTP